MDRSLDIIGKLPSGDAGLKRRARFHQCWWRAFVLDEPQGANPARKDEAVCNTLQGGEASGKNFLVPSALEAIRQTLEERKDFEAGMLNLDRLYNNLLSSQPLAFNFFGALKQDHALALGILSAFIPEATRVTRVLFEFAPREKYTGDNSVFDVAIEFEAGSRKGLLGLECKYTDSFSKEEFDKEAYRSIFARSANFPLPYGDYIASRFNQLFRGQLIAEALVQNGRYDFAQTGLFCFERDAEALETGKTFRSMLGNGVADFKIITYADFISSAQKLDLDWERRVWTMMLWARYGGFSLSEPLFGKS